MNRFCLSAHQIICYWLLHFQSLRRCWFFFLLCIILFDIPYSKQFVVFYFYSQCERICVLCACVIKKKIVWVYVFLPIEDFYCMWFKRKKKLTIVRALYQIHWQQIKKNAKSNAMPNSITIEINTFYAFHREQNCRFTSNKNKEKMKKRTNDNNSLIAERTQWQTMYERSATRQTDQSNMYKESKQRNKKKNTAKIVCFTSTPTVARPLFRFLLN